MPARLDPAHLAAAGANRGEAAAGQKAQQTILLAEDDATTRELCTNILKKQGYLVLAASDGKQALTLAAQHQGPVHLLLSDLIMPHLGGLQLPGALRELRPGVKVVLTAGCLLLHPPWLPGMEFLPKPFGAAVLADLVGELLR